MSAVVSYFLVNHSLPNAFAFGKRDCAPRLMARKPARRLSA